MKKKLFLLPGLMCTEKLWYKLNIQNFFELHYLQIPKQNSLQKIIEKLHVKLKDEKKINLIGFSLGGYLALKYLCDYPLNIEKVYIISSGINSLDKEEIKSRKILLEYLEKNKINSLSKKAINKLLAFEKVSHIEFINEMFEELGFDIYKQQLKSSLYRENLYSTLLENKKPLRFFYSNEDKIIRTKEINRLIQVNTNIKQKVINSKSHMLPLEYSNALNTDIIDYFK